MKKIVTVILVLCSLLFCSFGCEAASPFIETPELENKMNEYFAQIDQSEMLLEKQKAAHDMANAARKLGYDEDNAIIQQAKAEWSIAETNLTLNQIAMEQWNKRYEEYPYATYVWLYLTQTLGYTPAVAAGIIGNMVAECGGTTLNLHYWTVSPGGAFYGLCQWSKTYFPDVRGQDLIYQCDYLANTIKEQFDYFGSSFRKGYTLETFLETQTPEEAAWAFAACYERCDTKSYGARKNYAKMAYEYFVA